MSAGARAMSDWFRARRDARLQKLMMSVPRKYEYLRVIDIGGSMSYWDRLGIDFLKKHKIHVDILNLFDAEFHQRADCDEIFNFIIGDARLTGLPDFSYDLCHSNSVIEHVGLWWDFEAFAREVRRLAPVYYVQTPNFWFPVDPHYWRFPGIHWLPRPVRVRLLQLLPLAHAGRAPDYRTACEYADDARLLNRAQMRCLFPDADLHAERVLLLAKSWIAVGRGAAADGGDRASGHAGALPQRATRRM